MILAPPTLWSGPRPTRSAARSRPPRAETPPLPATCRWRCSLLRSQPDQPSHGRGNASSRPFRLRSLGRARDISDLEPRVSACVVPRFAGHAVLPRRHGSQTVFDDSRIALAAAGSGPVIGAARKSQTFGARCRLTVDVQVSHSGSGCLDGLPAAPPHNTHRVATETSRRGTRGRASKALTGPNAARSDRTEISPPQAFLSFGCSPSFLRGHRTSPGV